MKKKYSLVLYILVGSALIVLLFLGYSVYKNTKFYSSTTSSYVSDEETYSSSTTELDEVVPPITEWELDQGWYWGSLSQKKPGTPDDWVHFGEETRSARWHRPTLYLYDESISDGN